MSNELLNLKRRSLAMGLCGQYKQLWDEASDRNTLAMIATDPNGAEFLCDAFAFGWGMTVGYMKENFADFLSPEYTIPHGGYSSRLYIDEIISCRTDTTVSIFLGCTGAIRIPEWMVCKIYIADNSGKSIIVENLGEAEIYLYGNARIIEKGHRRAKVKHLTESAWHRKKQ